MNKKQQQTQKNDVLAKGTEGALAIYDAMHSNSDTFVQKIKVTDLKFQQGKQKTNDKGETIFGTDGKPEFWDDSYNLSFVSLERGGTHRVKISQELFQTLTVGLTYFASGYIDYIQYKDSYSSTAKITFDKFISERDYFISQMKNQLATQDVSSVQK